ncbi:MAG: ABC transporter permease [Gammaproteobacteria bacterium]
MLRWLVRRLVAAGFILFAVSTLVFLVTHVFTDPALVSLPLDVSEQQLESRRELMGLQAPLASQYTDFVKGLLTLDLGESFWQQRSAWDVVAERLPNTLQLVGAGMVVAVVASVPLGLLAAWHENRVADQVVITASLVSISAPPFWIAYILIIVFSVNLGWAPTFGSSGFRSIVLPAVSIGLASAGRLSQVLRRAVVEELRAPYALTSMSRGFSRSYTILHHTLRNAGNSFTTYTGWELTRMFTGYTVVVEVVFAWPGVGQLAVQSVEQKDLVLLQAAVLVLAALVVTTNLLVDIARRLIDPRVQLT